MKAVIVEDDEIFQDELSMLIRSNLGIEDIDFLTYEYNKIYSNRYIICFIDIYLHNANGIDIARQYKQIYPNSQIVFMSNRNGIVYNAQVVDMFYFIRK